MAFPARGALLEDRTRTGAAWCRALSAVTDVWLAELFATAVEGAPGRYALVAVGGYGRGELAPWSDLDVVLLHDDPKRVDAVAQRLWYPIWDTKLKLGHGVRTVKEASRLAAEDLDTATSLLDIRHLAGDQRLTAELRAEGLRRWRDRARVWLAALSERVKERHQASGEVAFLLEPDLKDGRGGLRDVHALNWATKAGAVLLPGDDWALAAAYDVLLGARVELHRLAGRPGDILALQEQDGVAAALQMASADALMGAIAASARTIAWTSDEAWQRIDSTLAGPAGRGHRRDHPVASGVVVRDGEIHLDHGANPASDPTLVLRVATASARKRAHIERATLDRLAAETAPWPDPWPPGAVDDFVALLLQGHAAIGVLESLDQRGLLVRVLPEWVMVRSKPQRNAYHRFTVDRHLWETAANAADLADRVKRPDLLVLGALLHDLGKGLPGDHTDNGVALVGRLGPGLGLNEADTAVLVAMVRHHLLLPDTATRRDLSDDATLTFVADAVGDVVTLELLAALTEADSKATGPSAWSSWKAELVAELADRVAHVLGGGDMAGATWSQFPSEELLAEMGAGRIAVHAEGDRLTVVAPDRPGLFSAITGVLALHGLPVLDAMAHSDEQGMAASSYRIEVPDETGAAWHRVEKDVERALAGRLALEARLAERAHTYRRRSSAPVKAIEPSVRIDNGASSGATVIEVRGADRIGLLHRLTQALAEVSLDIRRAKVQTMGHEVLDSFYVRTHEGEKVTDADHLGEVRRALLHAVSG